MSFISSGRASRPSAGAPTRRAVLYPCSSSSRAVEYSAKDQCLDMGMHRLGLKVSLTGRPHNVVSNTSCLRWAGSLVEDCNVSTRWKFGTLGLWDVRSRYSPPPQPFGRGRGALFFLVLAGSSLETRTNSSPASCMHASCVWSFRAAQLPGH
jgi:hypothetical protein